MFLFCLKVRILILYVSCICLSVCLSPVPEIICRYLFTTQTHERAEVWQIHYPCAVALKKGNFFPFILQILTFSLCVFVRKMFSLASTQARGSYLGDCALTTFEEKKFGLKKTNALCIFFLSKFACPAVVCLRIYCLLGQL